MSTFTTEGEYIAIDHAKREKVWIKRFIYDLQLKVIGFILKNNNKDNISFTKNFKSYH